MTADRHAPNTPERHGHRSHAAAPLTSDAYERLLAGETVSWDQILREHPLLGTITVTHLVNTGVVEVMPEYDACMDTTDFRLRTREPRSAEGTPTAHHE